MTDHRRHYEPVARRFKSLPPESLPFKIERHIGFVPALGLCTMCGTCEGVCPEDAVRMELTPSKGILEPRVDSERCTGCGVCVDACPGFALDLRAPLPGKEEREQASYSPLIGTHRGIYRMQSLDSATLSGAASGGMVSEVLAYLLQEGIVDGAIVTRMDERDPLSTESFVATSVEQLVPAQKSKYLPVPLNRILRQVIRGDIPQPRLAYIGLPCHVEGLRLAQAAFPVLRERITHVLSIFCSRIPSLHATRYLLDRNRIAQSELARIDYRGSGHPGQLTFELKDGSRRHVPHLHWSYWGYAFLQFFYPTRCFMCHDKTGEQADLSFGDNWLVYGHDRHGTSSVVARTETGAAVLDGMVARGRVLLYQQMTGEQFIRDQDLMKKKGMGNRLLLMRGFGRAVPIYDQEFEPQWRDLPRTFRMFRHVLMAEHDLPFKLLRPYIFLSYLKSRALRILRTGAKLGHRLLRESLRLLLAPLPVSANAPARQSRYKILIIGGFGEHDIGDESMPRADIRTLRSELGDEVEIVMLSPNPPSTEAYHGERAVMDLRELGLHAGGGLNRLANPLALMNIALFVFGAWCQRYGVRLRLWPTARDALDELAAADLLLNVGGGNLNSVIPSELYKKGTLYLAARLLRKPVVLSGQTIGPFAGRLDRWFARECLSRVHMITFRDKDTSHERCRRLKVRGPLMEDAADDAMTLPAIERSAAEGILDAESGPGWYRSGQDLLVVMNMKASLRQFKRAGGGSALGRENELLAHVADHLIEAYDARVLFVPTDYSIAADDREAHVAIRNAMRHGNRTRTLDRMYRDSELKGVIGLAGIACGARYHFCVFAASMKVPFLGMASGEYQRTKLRGLAELCELPDCYLDAEMESVADELVNRRLRDIIERRATISEQLGSIVPRLEQRSVRAVMEAVALLRRRDAAT